MLAAVSWLFVVDQMPLTLLPAPINSAAEAASLMLGDILIGADGSSSDSIEHFDQLLEGLGERVVRLQFLRGDRSRVRSVAVRLALSSLAAA